MSNSILITRPNHDSVTKYLCVWAGSIKEMAKNKGVNVYDLKGSKATKIQFDSYIKRRGPSFLFMNGHGSRDVITGHDDEVLVDETTDLKNKILYARSCDAGQALGPSLIGSGLKAFIGYARRFILGYLPDKITRPEEDSIANLFLEPSNLVASTLLKGHTAKEAHLRSREAMNKNFRKMISSAAGFDERYAAKWLWSNMNSQILLGDSESKI